MAMLFSHPSFFFAKALAIYRIEKKQPGIQKIQNKTPNIGNTLSEAYSFHQFSNFRGAFFS